MAQLAQVGIVLVSHSARLAEGAADLAALTVGPLPALSLAEAPDAYWAQRAARPWH